MVLNTRHTGIVVRDIQKSILFYSGLGMRIKSSEKESGTYVGKLVGLDEVIIEWAKLELADGSLLELLQYHTHPVTEDIELQKANKLGCSHIALTVANIDSTVKYFTENGGFVPREVQTSPNGLVKVAYCYDPEGNIIEIVEEINHVKHK